MSERDLSGEHDLSSEFDVVEVERLIAATPERLWQIVGSAEGMRDWLSLCVFQPRLGGRILLDTSGSNEADRIVVFGRITALEAERHVAFSWAQLSSDRRVWPVDTLLEVSLSAQPGGEPPVPYIGRRVIPQLREIPAAARVTIASTDRPDLLAQHALGEPLLYWRVADANAVTDPFELTATLGRRVAIPAPPGA